LFLRIIYVIFLLCILFLTGGVFCGRGVGRVVDIVLYRNGFKMVLADSTLSVSGGGTPTHHKWEWGMGGVNTSKVRLLGKC
jgi:hypothetical protein